MSQDAWSVQEINGLHIRDFYLLGNIIRLLVYYGLQYKRKLTQKQLN